MAHPVIDESLGSDLPKELLLKKHTQFLLACKDENDSTLDYLKLSGIFWTLTALDLVGSLHLVNKDEVVDFVLSCQQKDGGFSPSPNHDSHLLSTLSGIQVLALFDSINKIDVEAACKFIADLQQKDGSFSGDLWGEIDTRFAFCALASLILLDKLSNDIVDLEACASYLERCQNLDGGFGTLPGSESHAGQAYCVVGSMAMLRQLHRLDLDRAAWWLAERQLPSGGLNGRPEKKPDVCYSWWAVATLTILGRIKWISDQDLTRFILASQDNQTGGIADRPGNYPDPFHTLFGLAGLSLMAQVNPSFLLEAEEPLETKASNNDFELDQFSPRAALRTVRDCLKPINPVLCMPQEIIDRMELKLQILL